MNRKEQIIQLWKEVFNDSDEFLQLFFNRVYRDENAISLEKEGKIVTVLQMLPYTMTWCGEEIPVSYIYAACTAPEERGQGWMQRLLEKTHDIMRKRGFYLSMLIPASESLFEFYRRHEYTEVFDYTLTSVTLQEVNNRIEELENNRRTTNCFITENLLSAEYKHSVIEADDANEWFPFFDSKLRERKSCVLHSLEDFRTLIMDYALGGGRVLGLCYKGSGEPQGIAFIQHFEDGIIIKELLSTGEIQQLLLLQKAMAYFAVEKVKYRSPARIPDTKRLGEALILNRKAMITKWLAYHPETTYSKSELEEMKTGELTDLLMGYAHREAYMSLMMD